MASYQDIDSRVRVIEDKIDFVMNSFSITKSYPSPISPGGVLIEQTNLLKVYQELKNGSIITGAAVGEVPSQEVGEADDSGK